MSLREVQVFLATYVRDQDFRHRYRAGEAAELERSLSLSADDIALIGQIKLDHLDYIAEFVLGERLGRIGGVFGLLLEHLAKFVDVAERFRAFDRDWKGGWWQRRAEIRRFEVFVLDLVAGGQLPEYLIDLCRFCAEVTVVAESPKVNPGERADLPGLTRVRGNDVITLRGPFTVSRLRHDVIRIMEDPEGYGDNPFPLPTEILIQRDWRQHKRSRVFRMADEPILRALAGRPATTFELGGILPEFSYASLLSAVAGLFSDQIVHVTVAKELAGDFPPASAS